MVYLKYVGVRLAGYCNCGFEIAAFFFHRQGYSRTRELDSEELLEQLPALQQLLYRLIGCRVKHLELLDHQFFLPVC